MSKEALLFKKRDTGITIISINDAPMNPQRLNLIRRIKIMDTPSIATLFGYCLDGELELPLGCTFRLAATEGAQIGLPEMDLGIVTA